MNQTKKLPDFVTGTRAINYPTNSSTDGGYLFPIQEKQQFLFRSKKRRGTDRRRTPAQWFLAVAIAWSPIFGFSVMAEKRDTDQQSEKGDPVRIPVARLERADLPKLESTYARLLTVAKLAAHMKAMPGERVTFRASINVLGADDTLKEVRTIYFQSGELYASPVPFPPPGSVQFPISALSDGMGIDALLEIFEATAHLPPPFNVPSGTEFKDTRVVPPVKEAEGAALKNLVEGNPDQEISVPKRLIDLATLVLMHFAGPGAAPDGSPSQMARQVYEALQALRNQSSDVQALLELYSKLEPQLAELGSAGAPYPVPFRAPPLAAGADWGAPGSSSFSTTALVTVNRDGSITLHGDVKIKHSKG